VLKKENFAKTHTAIAAFAAGRFNGAEFCLPSTLPVMRAACRARAMPRQSFFNITMTLLLRNVEDEREHGEPGAGVKRTH
jgi:hypothetical protein